MKYLLYCILRNSAAPPPDGCAGVFAVAAGSLAAAASLVADDTTRPDVTALRQYARVVAAWHAERTIIPLRYGCILPDKAQIVRLLEEHQADWQRLLGELDGRVEMGLRILWKPGTERSSPAGAGAGYLEGARRRASLPLPREEGWADRVCEQMRNLTVRVRRQARPAAGGRLLSLDFLIAASSVKEFRDRVRRLEISPEWRVLASGPWPPYNFVEDAGEYASDDRGGRAALRVAV